MAVISIGVVSARVVRYVFGAIKGAHCEPAAKWGELMEWACFLACITGTVDQALLLRNEYLAAANHILRAQWKGRPKLSDAERAKLDAIGRRLGRKAGLHLDPPGAVGGGRLIHGRVLTLRGLATYYVMLFIHLESRRVDIAGITIHPAELWMKQIAGNVTMEGCGVLQDCS